MIWLDGLDLPLLKALDVIFTEHAASEQYGTRSQTMSRHACIISPDWRPANAQNTPLFALAELQMEPHLQRRWRPARVGRDAPR